MKTQALTENELNYLENLSEIQMTEEDIEDFFGFKNYVHIPMFFKTIKGFISRAIVTLTKKNLSDINHLRFVYDHNKIEILAYIYERPNQNKTIKSPSDVFWDRF